MIQSPQAEALAALSKYDEPHAEDEHPSRCFEVARSLRLLLNERHSDVC